VVGMDQAYTAVYVCSVLLIRVSVLMLSRCVFGQECLGLSHGGGS
jgi:hypothetical protein